MKRWMVRGSRGSDDAVFHEDLSCPRLRGRREPRPVNEATLMALHARPCRNCVGVEVMVHG